MRRAYVLFFLLMFLSIIGVSSTEKKSVELEVNFPAGNVRITVEYYDPYSDVIWVNANGEENDTYLREYNISYVLVKLDYIFIEGGERTNFSIIEARLIEGSYILTFSLPVKIEIPYKVNPGNYRITLTFAFTYTEGYEKNFYSGIVTFITTTKYARISFDIRKPGIHPSVWHTLLISTIAYVILRLIESPFRRGITKIIERVRRGRT